jgi:hypothetical protein
MLADIDAYNIGVLSSSPSKLSEVLKGYYFNDVNKRYSIFVNNIGGIDTLQKEQILIQFMHQGQPRLIFCANGKFLK